MSETREEWMKRHGVEVIRTSTSEIEEDEFGRDFGPYNITRGGKTIGVGITLDEALSDFAAKSGIPMWDEEGAK